MSIAEGFFAYFYDNMTAGAEKAGLRAHRQALLAKASGRVLEIGGGTGANLPFYGSGVTSLTITEPSEPMARRLERRLAQLELPLPAVAEVVRAPAEELPFDRDSFDAAVSTLVLCTVGDQERALAELGRVLRPGGSLLFIEHVRSDSPGLARWQQRFNPLQRVIGCGCNCNRATVQRARTAGFEITELAHDDLRKVPPWVRPLRVGVAQS
jgi:ubiquinone/menaquinone biosynthesis C-methylase UbiE